MSENQPVAITISREVGSGGAYLGQRLAARLGFAYLDREILRETARRLDLTEETLAHRSEAITPLWLSLLESFRFGAADVSYVPPPLSAPSDGEFFQAESEVISRVASERSVVVIGRCGYHVLRDHPRLLSVFLHGSLKFRSSRLQYLYHLSEQEALQRIKASDRERVRYHRAKTGNNMEARLFHICLDTGAIGLKTAEEVVCLCLREHFGIDVPLGCAGPDAPGTI